MRFDVEQSWPLTRPRRTVIGGVSLILVALALLLGAGPAQAEFGVTGFDGSVLDADGNGFTQAGGTPYSVGTKIEFATKSNPNMFPTVGWSDEPVKDVVVDLPPGLVGNPTGMPRCTAAQLAPAPGAFGPLCPTGSQVGLVRVRSNGGLTLAAKPVFLMVPPPDVPARFGFYVAGSMIVLDAKLRSDGDYGISIVSRNASEGIPVTGVAVEFWGVPADPSHDAQRSCPGMNEPAIGGPSCATESPRRSFLRLPTACTPAGEGLLTTVRAASWYDPDDFKSASFESHLPPGLLSVPPELDPASWGPAAGPEGCDRVPFDPSFTVEPAQPARAGTPSGYAFDLKMPQTTNPDIVSHGDLKKVVVTLPKGVRVSPPSAWGLEGCSPAQVKLHSLADAACPDASKLGTLRIDTPLLEEPLEGAAYLATPKDNPSGTLLAMYLVAKGPGVTIKLAGRVDADPVSGQLTATFDDNPQAPVSRLHLELFDGERAALVNPRSCGTYTTRAVLSSWSGRTVTSESSFTLDRDSHGDACGAPRFAPDFAAGTDNPVAGAFATFVTGIRRDDEDQEVRSLSVRPPQGLAAKRKGVERCSSERAAAGTCGEASLVGTASTGAGAGSTPFFVDGGRVYLTVGYKGAPYGLSIVVPVVAGPFDLGTVVVRAAVYVDRHTAALRIVSDPLPTILEGIPLQVRDIRVRIDREKFMINPTDCQEKQVRATLTSTEGRSADVATRFQVGECGALRFNPKLRLTVGGKGRTGRGASTPLTATVKQRPGQANLASVAVSLPLSLNARLPVVEDACTLAEFEANDCAKARAGTAVAVTPLLPGKLRGSAYFVKDPKKPKGSLPNLIVALRGEIDFDLVGKITIPGGSRLATTFSATPDVPITSFTLRMFAGKNGAVGVAENLCSRKGRRATARVVIKAQNGHVLRARQRLNVRGCRKGG